MNTDNNEEASRQEMAEQLANRIVREITSDQRLNGIRTQLLPLADDILAATAKNPEAPQAVRLVAGDILAERLALKTAAEVRARTRKAAREIAAVSEDVLIADAGAQTPNEADAKRFAAVIAAKAGIKVTVRKTLAVANVGKVKDGWAVFARDEEQEINLTAVWYGRRHLQTFLEIAGHAERTDEAAALFLRVLNVEGDVGGGEMEEEADKE